MIVGRTLASLYSWRKVFVFWPRRLIDGRYAFCQTIERIHYFAKEIPEHTFHSSNNWCYREISE